MKTVLKKGALLFILISSAFIAFGQRQYSKFEWGLNGGWFFYQGDLTPSRLGSFPTKHIGFDLFAERAISSQFSLRTNLAFSKLEGDDSKFANPKWRRQRNFYFKSPLFEISELLVGDILGKNYSSSGVSPYAFGGIGVAFLNPKRDWSRINKEYFPPTNDVWAGLTIDSAHSVPRIIPVIPVGMGIKYILSDNWTLRVEGAYRLSFTDYIDGFSKAANPKQNDHYFSTTIGISYRPGNASKWKCPTVQ